MKNTFWDLIIKNFKYQLAIKEYKDIKFPIDKSVTRLMFVFKILMIVILLVNVYLDNYLSSCIIILCLLWNQLCTDMEFTMFYKNEELFYEFDGHEKKAEAIEKTDKKKY